MFAFIKSYACKFQKDHFLNFCLFFRTIAAFNKPKHLIRPIQPFTCYRLLLLEKSFCGPHAFLPKLTLFGPGKIL